MDEQAAAVLEYGGLTALLEGADLRYVRAGDEELVRRIFVTVRDAHWRTLEPRIEHVEVRRSHGEFDVQLQVRHVSGDLDFRWSGLIRGRGDSELEYTMDGRIAHACAYNRIGFCVLHPLRESIGRHYGGVGDAGAFTGAISALVAPQRFVGGRFVALCPPARSLWIDRPGGGRVSFEFEGDLFEMEDQRNWSDGSLKTYCTPLELGFPHQAAAEQRIHRELRVAVSGTRPKHRPARHPTSTEIVLGKVGDTRLPTLGVAWPAEVTSARGRVAELVRDLGLDHLRVEVDPGVPESITALNDAAGTSRTTGCPLELALYISADSRDLLAHMASRLTASPIARVLVFHRDGRYVESTETTPPGLVTLARETLGSSLAPGTPVGGGTDMSFCELNRTRPDADGLDVVSYALMPQIHADDERSIVEGLEAQADVVRSARALAGGRPIAVTPVTLVPRHGPLGERLAVARTDARQASWFAAAWTLGSLSQLARGGADSVTYYETIGERGISPLEDLAVTHGGESPLYRLLAELADWRASRVLQCTINDPLRAAGLALQRPDGAIRVLVADLSGDANTILVGPIALDSARLRMLGERARDGAQSRPQPARSTAVEGGMVSVELGPYGVACIDADRSVVV